jgi:hypothetical protein
LWLYLQSEIEAGLTLDDIVLILLLFADDMAIGKSPDEKTDCFESVIVLLYY